MSLVVPSTIERAARDLIGRAALHARAQDLARDLVNTPAVDLGPTELAETAVAACGETCEVEVWDESRLEAERCGGVLAVGRGSTRPPRMAVIRYRPQGAVADVALVGKGIVFDSGGLSLKRPNEHMRDMKLDMAGAATVIAVCSVLAELGIHVAVTGVCPIAENMPSGRALRPGDVVRIRDGTTVEVRDTDAEGRLVLADALSYAAESDRDAIVDVATLTGAVRSAVGARATGVFGTDDDLVRQLLHAAADAGEPAWQLPLWDDLEENLESEVADLNNTGEGDFGGPTMGGLFLRHFAGDQPWAHLDIGGSSWAEHTRHHLHTGGTGTAVRTLLRWLEQP